MKGIYKKNLKTIVFFNEGFTIINSRVLILWISQTLSEQHFFGTNSQTVTERFLNRVNWNTIEFFEPSELEYYRVSTERNYLKKTIAKR